MEDSPGNYLKPILISPILNRYFSANNLKAYQNFTHKAVITTGTSAMPKWLVVTKNGLAIAHLKLQLN